jgi:hypothetical protein
VESKLKTKGHELEESQKRLDKLEEHIRVSRIQLEEQEKMASGTSRMFHFICALVQSTSEYLTVRYSNGHFSDTFEIRFSNGENGHFVSTIRKPDFKMAASLDQFGMNKIFDL